MGTAQLGNRDNRRPRPLLDLELTVSGSLTQTQSPKTPRNRVFFRISSGSYRKVSARRDSMAVGGVKGELVFATRSLLGRESTGNLFDLSLI